MAKKQNKLWAWVLLLTMTLVTLGIAGLFINGTFLTVPILKYIPTVIHTVFGWLLVIGTLGNLVYKVYKAFA